MFSTAVVKGKHVRCLLNNCLPAYHSWSDTAIESLNETFFTRKGHWLALSYKGGHNSWLPLYKGPRFNDICEPCDLILRSTWFKSDVYMVALHHVRLLGYYGHHRFPVVEDKRGLVWSIGLEIRKIEENDKKIKRLK